MNTLDLIAKSISNGNLSLSDYSNGNYYLLQSEYFNKENYNKERSDIIAYLWEQESYGDMTELEIEDFCTLYPYID